MVSELFFYQLALIALLWLCFMLPWVWPSERVIPGSTLPPPPLLPRKRSREPKPFAGLTRKPPCAACEQAHEHVPQPPSWPATPYRAHAGTAAPGGHRAAFLPQCQLRLSGLGGLGQLVRQRASEWWPLAAILLHGLRGLFSGDARHTIPHGKRVAPDLLVGAVGALAEGLGIRAVARVFEVDPNTVLAWLVAVADHAAAFSQYFLHDVRVTQVQLDELFALLSAVKTGEVSEAEAITRLARSPHWVWAAIDPVTGSVLKVEMGAQLRALTSFKIESCGLHV